MILFWFASDEQKTRRRVAAASGKWNGRFWELQGVTEYVMDIKGRVIGDPRIYASKNYPELKVPPKDLAHASLDSVFLTYRQMKMAMKRLKESGVHVDAEAVELHRRLSSPWQSLVMMFFVIPFLGRTRSRKGIALSMLICVGLAFGYHVLDALGLALGKSGVIIPFASAWLSNILFSVFGLLFLDKANY